MSILNDAQRDDDPRMKENVIIPPPPPPQAAPPLDLGSTPLPMDAPITPAPDLSGGGEIVTPPVAPSQPGLDSSIDVLMGGGQEEGLPPINPEVAGGVVEGEAEQLDTEGFGTQKPLQLQVMEEQQAARLQAEQQDPYENQFTQGSIVGAIQDSDNYYRGALRQNSDAWFAGARKNAVDVERTLRQQATRPTIPAKPNIGAPGSFDPDPLRNPFKPEEQSFFGGLVQNAIQQASRLGQAVGFRGGGPTFDPWYGGKQWLEEAKKNPIKFFEAPLLPFIVGSTGKYGEYGEGLVGSGLYILNSPVNLVVGLATDAQQLLTGNYKEKTPNVVQGLTGKAFDFTQDNSTRKPFSTIGKNTTPQTWSELRGRNFIYGLNPALALTSWISKLSGGGDKIPQGLQDALKHPDGGTWLRVPEVVAGLALDIAAPSPGELGNVKKMFDPSSWKPKPPTPTAGGEAAEIAGKFKPDMPAGVSVPKAPPEAPKPPMSIQEMSQKITEETNRINRRANAAVEAAKKAATRETTPQQLTEQVNAIRAKQQADIAAAKQSYNSLPRPDLGQAPNTPDVTPPATRVQATVLKPSEVVKGIVSEARPIDPTTAVFVLRRDDELTQFAINNGDYVGTSVLPKTRLDALAQSNPAYSRIGAPLPDEIKNIPLTPAPERQPLSQTQIFEQLFQIRKQLDTPGLSAEQFQQLAIQGNDLVNQLSEAPKLVNNPARLEEIKTYLPPSQIPISSQNLKFTEDFLAKEKAFQEATEIASSVAKEQEDVMEVASRYIENIDNVAPDLGRRPIQNPPLFTPKPLTSDEFSQAYLNTPAFDSAQELGSLVFREPEFTKPGKALNLIHPKGKPPTKATVNGIARADELLEAWGLTSKGEVSVIVTSPTSYTDDFSDGFRSLTNDRALEVREWARETGGDAADFDLPEEFFTKNPMFDGDSGAIFLKPAATAEQTTIDIIHEYAHKLFMDGANERVVDEFLSVPNIKSYAPSEYAQFSDDEFVAEAVAYAIINRRKIAPQLREAVTKLLSETSGKEPPRVKPANPIGFRGTPGKVKNVGDVAPPTAIDFTPQGTQTLDDADLMADVFINQRKLDNASRIDAEGAFQIARKEFLDRYVPGKGRDQFQYDTNKGLWLDERVQAAVKKKLADFYGAADDPLIDEYLQTLVRRNSGTGDAFNDINDELSFISQALKEKYPDVKKDPITRYLFSGVYEEPAMREALTDAIRKYTVGTVETPSWYHGTKVRGLDPAAIDALSGGSRGELGVGFYMTRKMDDAVDYALAPPSKNLPPIETRQFEEVGSVYKTNVSIQNPIDASAPVTPDVLAAIQAAFRESEALPADVKKALIRWTNKSKTFPLEDVYSKVDDALLKMNGYYPEEIGLDVMRRINDNIRQSGYDAIVKGDVMNYLGDGSKIQVNSITRHGTGDLMEQATHRYNADTKSLSYFPNSGMAKANQADATANITYQIERQLDEMAEQVSSESEQLARELVDAQIKLEDVVEQEQTRKLADDIRRATNKDDEMIRHNNKVDDNPCL